MRFRSQLLLAFALAAIVPVALIAIGVRGEVTARLVRQYEKRVEAQVQVARDDLTRESEAIALRLATLKQSLIDDDSVRLAVLRGLPGTRPYLLDYAARAMHLAGLSMLQLQDEQGRIISSGHFRNEFDRLDPALPHLLAEAGARAVLVRARTAQGPFLALARVDSLRLGARLLRIVGGIAVDSAFLARFRRDADVHVALQFYGDASPPGDSVNARRRVVGSLPLAYIDASSREGEQLDSTRLVIAQSLGELQLLRRDLALWMAGALIVALAGAVALAIWLSARLSRPIAELAQATSRIDLDGAHVAFATERPDEIGMLARRLAAMSSRLRASAGRLREAERRVTIGDMARQVNHDIRNGLIPIRNVLRHLSQIQAEQPGELPQVYGERRGTLESSVQYLEVLARNYAQLTPRSEHELIDVNAVVRDALASAADAVPSGTKIQSRLAQALPPVPGDPVALRRILDNLIRNAIESFDERGGSITVSTSRATVDAVVIQVLDTGRGMSEADARRAFEDFFTTKPAGTGLGLSVVRRLTADMGGEVRVQSAPGKGTTFAIQLPSSIRPTERANS